MKNKSIKKEVILNLIQDLQRLLLSFINGVRGRFQIKFGMTQLYNLGFTLIELLVVVIIIGVLTAVAVPMYKHAVLKSNFSTVMPMAKAVAEAQEVYYLGSNYYAAADELDLLDIAVPPNSEKVAIALSDSDQFNYVLAKRTDNDHVHYIMYQKNSPNFPNNIHCEADDDDGKWLCQNLGGVKAAGSLSEGFTTYILQGSATDGHYGTIYMNPTNYVTLNGGDQCIAEIGTCRGVKAKDGAICWAKQGNGGCNSGGNYNGTSTFDNSKCISDTGTNSACSGYSPSSRPATFTNGSTCEAKGSISCAYDDFTDSTCVGIGNGSCQSSNFSNSTCEGQQSTTCAFNTFTDGSTCQGKSASSCGTGKFTDSTCEGEGAASCTDIESFNHSTCNGGSDGACGAYLGSSLAQAPVESRRPTFDNQSVCNGNGEYSCRGINFTNNSVCNANVANSCVFARYDSNSYCIGDNCQTGTPKGKWNDSTNQYESDGWNGSCCDSTYMTDGTCPAGATPC